jgi:hypothetical protein
LRCVSTAAVTHAKADARRRLSSRVCLPKCSAAVPELAVRHGFPGSWLHRRICADSCQHTAAQVAQAPACALQPLTGCASVVAEEPWSASREVSVEPRTPPGADFPHILPSLLSTASAGGLVQARRLPAPVFQQPSSHGRHSQLSSTGRAGQHIAASLEMKG